MKVKSYDVSFIGCTHVLNFDFCIGYDVVSDNELVVHCWHQDGNDLLEGEFSIVGLNGSFNAANDDTNLVQMLLTQYCICVY